MTINTIYHSDLIDLGERGVSGGWGGIVLPQTSGIMIALMNVNGVANSR